MAVSVFSLEFCCSGLGTLLHGFGMKSVITARPSGAEICVGMSGCYVRMKRRRAGVKCLHESGEAMGGISVPVEQFAGLEVFGNGLILIRSCK
jgi:hypothetical protein